MKLIKILPVLLSCSIVFSCNNSSNNTQSENAPGTDTTGTNPTTDASDYHPDQRQVIPVTDSSNTIGTDTLNASEATPNTGTNKSYNDAKENKDSSKH